MTESIKAVAMLCRRGTDAAANAGYYIFIISIEGEQTDAKIPEKLSQIGTMPHSDEAERKITRFVGRQSELLEELAKIGITVTLV